MGQFMHGNPAIGDDRQRAIHGMFGNTRVKALRVIFGWVIAVVMTVVLGSIIQTQFNLAAIAGLGVEISLMTRLGTTWHDVVHFTPAYAILVTLAFAVAWPVAALLQRWLPGHRSLLFIIAGFAAIVVLIVVMNRALPVTGIAATREGVATLMLAAAGAFAGWLYAQVLVRRGDS